jgi:hypothetical protein
MGSTYTVIVLTWLTSLFLGTIAGMSFYRATLAPLVMLLGGVGVLRGRTTWEKVDAPFYLSSLALSGILYLAVMWIAGWMSETVDLSETDGTIAYGVFMTGYVLSFLSGFQVGKSPVLIVNEVWRAAFGDD